MTEREKEIMNYALYMQDHSGFESISFHANLNKTLEKAKEIYADGDGGYAIVSVHEVDDSKELNEENAKVIYGNI